jgi:signal transduction histidine kinase
MEHHVSQPRRETDGDRLSLLLEAISDGLWEWDVPRGEVRFSPQWFTMLGHEPDARAHDRRTWARLIHPGDRPQAEMNNAQRELITSDGESIPTLKTVLPLTLDGREYLLECFKDIRHLKDVEAERIEKEKLQAMMETAGSICHEMNQPLQILSGFSELLLMDCKEGGKQASTLKTINDQAHRMGGITRKLKNLTHFQTKTYLGGRIVDIDMSSRPEDRAPPGDGPRAIREDPAPGTALGED